MIKVETAKGDDTDALVEKLMGKKAELRFQFIQENAAFAKDSIDV